jgi:hypothetical protein
MRAATMRKLGHAGINDAVSTPQQIQNDHEVRMEYLQFRFSQPKGACCNIIEVVNIHYGVTMGN